MSKNVEKTEANVLSSPNEVWMGYYYHFAVLSASPPTFLLDYVPEVLAI